MSEKLFIVGEKDYSRLLAPNTVARLLNKQQDQISKLQDLCGKSDYENAKLRQELKQKEEEEKLYAQEILRLNTLLKQYQSFKDLAGDY